MSTWDDRAQTARGWRDGGEETTRASRWRRVVTLSLLAGLVSLAAAQAQLVKILPVALTDCPPNGYIANADETVTKIPQPPFDFDSDADGVADAWSTPLVIEDFNGNTLSADETANVKLAMVCLPDPRGAGCGNDFFSPRVITDRTPDAGIPIGMCNFPEGTNAWFANVLDKDGNGKPDTFLNMIFVNTNPATGESLVYKTDLTRNILVTTRSTASEGRKRTGDPPPPFVLGEIGLAELGIDPRDLLVDGEPLSPPDPTTAGASDNAAQVFGDGSSQLVNTIDYLEHLPSGTTSGVDGPGADFVVLGTVVNQGLESLTVGIDLRFAYASSYFVPDSLRSLDLAPGESYSYFAFASTYGGNPLAVTSMAFVEEPGTPQPGASTTPDPAFDSAVDDSVIFADGFESGDAASWQSGK